jgi:hypothetical protein
LVVVALGVLLALLLAASLLARPAPSRAKGAGPPPPEALQGLENAKQELIAAQGLRTLKVGWLRAVQAAEGDKLDFVRDAFDDQLILGCNAKILLERLDEVDQSLAAANEPTVHSRRHRLGGAAENADALARTVTTNCQAGDRGNAIVLDIVTRTQRLVDKYRSGNLTTKQIGRQAGVVADQKRSLLEGQVVYGCDIVPFHVSIDRIDGLLGRAMVLVPERGDHTKRAEKLVDQALDEVDSLIDRWMLVPCAQGR